VTPPSPTTGPLDRVTVIRGESFVVSEPDGDIRRGADTGLFVRDTRFLDRMELTVNGAPAHPLRGGRLGPSVGTFHGYIRPESSDVIDPTVLVTRQRVVAGSMHEEIVIDNRGRTSVELEVDLACGTDFAYIFDVKHGRERPRVEPHAADGGLSFAHPGRPERVAVTAAPGGRVERGSLRWTVALQPGESQRICLDVTVTDTHGTEQPRRRCEAFHRPAPAPPPVEGPELRCSDRRLERLVATSINDLTSLTIEDPDQRSDRFCVAGTPWYLTLFGRDALWAALMALPYDLDLAAGTLRALARRQGRRVDLDTEEAPGKILHEIRRGSLSDRGQLPSTYYGTIDATPLWIILLSEAWHWGMPEPEVTELIPNLQAALRWLEEHAITGDDGFVRYIRHGDRGLANQGWKDSEDGVQFADGRVAEAPIALSEVQGYAYDAALRGAELLEHFGVGDPDAWRGWGAGLAERFRARFWVEDEDGPFPAIALDREGEAVDAPTSNIGHLLTSGILSDQESRTVARRLAAPTMSSGWGLRTMGTRAAGFNPLSYHGGSVWPHDTAIAIWGLARSGHHPAARRLLRGLVRAAPHFDFRLPELFAGNERIPGGFPLPYPMACQPQAWSAGAALLLLRACLGAEAHVPRGVLELAPLWPPPFRRLELGPLPVADGELHVVVDVESGIAADHSGDGLEIVLSSPEGDAEPR
jgi:glycogen debranching enzyme